LQDALENWMKNKDGNEDFDEDTQKKIIKEQEKLKK